MLAGDRRSDGQNHHHPVQSHHRLRALQTRRVKGVKSKYRRCRHLDRTPRSHLLGLSPNHKQSPLLSAH
ncbi:Uncharacterised protein [Vibrio cholerae]|nr:Uncharacterised protein [Vibrio cholerae]